jgi:DNA (cytosine-5)-methyltransferase 1
VVSTFAGCGGSSLGYSAAGFRELAATDHWDLAAEVFRRNFPKVPFIEADIAALSAEELMEAAGVGLGELDLLDGSPPCQGFSTAGKRQLDDPRNSLFLEFARLLEGVRPRMFLMENVSGMVKGKMRLVFREIINELEGCGYEVRAWKINAIRFGVPQDRLRVIFVGSRSDLELALKPPIPTHLERPYSFAEALGIDPAGPPGVYTSGFSAGDRRHRAMPAASINARGLDGSGPGQFNSFISNSERASYIPGPPISPRAREIALKMIDDGKVMGSAEWCGKIGDIKNPIGSIVSNPGHGSRIFVAETFLTQTSAAGGFVQGSPRRRASEPSTTVTSESGDSAQKLWGSGESEPRSLSIGEVMRLQSFPDQWSFDGFSWRDAWAMVGNSVPPLMMAGIAAHIRDQLRGLPK